MREITVSVDDATYRQSRIRAAELDTTVSALVRGFLEDLISAREDESEGQVQGIASERERRQRILSEVFNDVRTTRPRFKASDSLLRDEIYRRGAIR